MMSDYDVVVVGGGAGGLSAALTLARARRSVLVVDAGHPRNAPAAHVHGYLGREGVAPSELLATGRAEVIGYGGTIVTGSVVSAERIEESGFRLVLADGGEVRSRRLVVATGLVDELPDVPGVAERWGRDVLHCPYCHGWEVRDQSIATMVNGPLALHTGLLWRQWTADVTMIVDSASELGDAGREQLAARDVTVVEGHVERLEVADDRLGGVRLVDGRLVACQAVVVRPRFVAHAAVLTSLGIDTVQHEVNGQSIGSYVPADPVGATSVPGVWVAGNVTDLLGQVLGSAAAGARPAGAINADLIADDVRRAVEDRVRLTPRFVGDPSPGGVSSQPSDSARQ